ncbi:YfiR family protein [Pseudoalteromonas sp.]|uniref:YfiR family protein n=1 Tax=Pseudoalteromonas sp. TaxID=53249 RepID=UPI0030022E5E
MKLSCLLLTVMSIIPGVLQAKSPEQVKSAFLFQIAKFIEFPKANNNKAVTFCFYDIEHGIGKLLKNNSTLKINNTPIETVLIDKNQQISELSRFCDITYIDETMEDDIIPLWIDTISLNTLTVGESINFLEKGGVVSLIQEGNKIRLYINRQQLLRSNFKVQSRLLAVSKFHPN